MNIGIIIKDYAAGKQFSKNGVPMKSGAEFHAENHALQLMRLGHKVTIMAKKRYWFTKARENINGIDLVRLHAPFRWLEIVIRLFTTHRGIDTFYILGHPPFAVWAILYARLFHKRTVLALTGKAEIFRQSSWRNRVLTKCDHYIALSQEIHDSLITETGIFPGKISILGQGISTERFSTVTDKEKNILRQKHGFAAEDIVLLFCARIVENKGIKTIMEIWPKLHNEFPTGKLLIAGGGQKDLIVQLERLSENNNNSVIMVGEIGDPKEYYQLSDIYILPSHHEGLPTTLMEAMSCGLPSVVSDIGGCRDLIQHDIHGYLCKVNDSDSFYDYTRKLFLSPDERRNFGKNATSFVRKHLDYKIVIPKLENILQQDR